MYITLYAQFTTPNTGSKYTFETLAAISSGAIVKENASTYAVNSNIQISAKDSLVVEGSGILVKINPNVTISISGYFESNAANTEYTSAVIGQPYTGFLFNDASKIILNNAKFSYGGGIKSFTDKLVVSNCEFYKNSKGISTSSIFEVTSPRANAPRNTVQINNNKFLENSSTAFYSGAENTGLDFINNYVYKNVSVGGAQVVIIDFTYITSTQQPVADSIRIINNQIIGGRSIVGTGGLRFSAFVIKSAITDNVIKDNRYGMSLSNQVSSLGISSSDTKVDNNSLEDNNVDNDLYKNAGIIINRSTTSSGGLGIFYLSRNKIRNNIVGVFIGGEAKADLGNDTNNIGQNVFYNNKYNNKLYAMYVENKNPFGGGTGPVPISKHNCWREGEASSFEMVKESIYLSGLMSPTITLDKVFPYLCSDGSGEMGTSNLNKESRNKVYPIPNKGVFNIFAFEDDEVVLFDISGRKVYEAGVKKGENKIAPNISKGIYLLRFKKSDDNIKVIID